MTELSSIQSSTTSAASIARAAFGSDVAPRGGVRPLGIAPAGVIEPELAEWRDMVQRVLWRTLKVIPEGAGHSVQLAHKVSACRRALRLSRGLTKAAGVVAVLVRELRDQPMVKGIYAELLRLYEKLPGHRPIATTYAERRTVPMKAPKLPAPNQQPLGFKDWTGTSLRGTKVLGPVNEVPPAVRSRGVHFNLRCVCGAPFVRASFEIERAERNGLCLRHHPNCRGGIRRGQANGRETRVFSNPDDYIGTTIGGAELLGRALSNEREVTMRCRCQCGVYFTRRLRLLRENKNNGLTVRCSSRCTGVAGKKRGAL